MNNDLVDVVVAGNALVREVKPSRSEVSGNEICSRGAEVARSPLPWPEVEGETLPDGREESGDMIEGRHRRSKSTRKFTTKIAEAFLCTVCALAIERYIRYDDEEGPFDDKKA